MQFSCLIIDDDKFERDGLRYMLKQADMPFAVSDVRNGKLALELMQNKYFDVVITDIKMPVMDGITFLEKAKTKYKDTAYIIYSGHSDFEYAKKAIRLQVLDFLLKPVSDQEFNKVMTAALAFAHKKRLEIMNRLLQELSGNRIYGMQIPGDLQLAYLSAEADLRNKLVSAAEQEDFCFLPVGSNDYLLMSNGAFNLHALLERELYFNYAITARVSGSYHDLYNAYRELASAAANYFFSKTAILDLASVAAADKESSAISTEEQLLEFLKRVKIIAKEKISKILPQLYPDRRRSDESFVSLLHSKTIEQIITIIKTQLTGEQSDVIFMVKRYINEHYGDDLSLDVLAEAVHLAPAYLSTLFKKYTHTALTHYIADLRIQKASYLLRNTTATSAEVAKAVGYNNISYFNAVFKSKTGKTPGQYRKLAFDGYVDKE